MYCAINYENNTSLWITKDCSVCELREGNYDLTQHIKTITKLNLQGKFDNYSQSYTYEFVVGKIYFQCSMCIMAHQLYIRYQALGYTQQMYVAPMEVLACPIKKDEDFYTNGVVFHFLWRYLNEVMAKSITLRELKTRVSDLGGQF